MTERDKLVKMVEHWIHHNKDHASSYRDWARRAQAMGEGEAGAVLERIASQTQQQDGSFEEILSLLKKGSSPASAD